MKKVLVVEGTTGQGPTAGQLIQQEKVLTASSAASAIDAIKQNPNLGIVILDLSLPRSECEAVLYFLQTEQLDQKLRTIILTTEDDPASELKGLQLGAQDYLRKPVTSEILQARLKLHLELIEKEQQINISSICQTLFQQAPIGISISPFDPDKEHLFHINPMCEQITGRTVEEFIEKGWASFTHPDDLEEDLNNLKKLRAGEIKSYKMEKRYIKPDGSIVWVEMVVAALEHPNSEKYYLCLLQDITKRKEAEAALLESERSKSVLLSHLPGLAYRFNYDRDWTMQYVSAGCLELTGYPPEDLLYNKTLSFNELIAPEYRDLLHAEWARILPKRIPFKFEYEIITASGERKWVMEMGQGIYNQDGEVEALEGIVLDISDRKKIEDSIVYNLNHDRWTGLYNRNFLETLLTRDAEKQIAQKRAVVSVNLSDIQQLIMTYGFHYAQDLIKNVADSLNTYTSDNCLLFRAYENLFVFYLKNYQDQNQLVEFCRDVADTLESLLGIERVGGGLGIVELEAGDSDTDEILKNLLIASEKAMDLYDGSFGFRFYDGNLEAQILKEDEITRTLTKVTAADNRLYVEYQPILDLKLNRITGFEALSRLNCDKHGRVLPEEFIPIAEKTKLIIPIGQEVFRQAFQFQNKLKAKAYDGINISINVSAIQLLRKDFTTNLFGLMESMKINPQTITLEITESVFASNYEDINRILGLLKAAGIRIAIDDFGTGYSSFARSRELNVDCLKIDKHFIDKLTVIQPELATTSDIISMTHKLGYVAIAEGVEHEMQKQHLHRFGCDQIQGYLISPPLNEVAAIDLLKKSTCC